MNFVPHESDEGDSGVPVFPGVLFYQTNGAVRARDPATGSLLWQGSVGGLQWESPIVANGAVYVTDQTGTLRGFALPATGTPTPTGTSTIIYLPYLGAVQVQSGLVLDLRCLARRDDVDRVGRSRLQIRFLGG
jgi:outer membrane protein assembly factor BamB